MLFSCSKCGRIHDKSYKCIGSFIAPKNNEQSLRSTYKWAKKSEQIRERSFHLCAICRANGDFTPKAVEVHHIIKLREDPTLLLADENLIVLCVEHHKAADRGELDIDYLRKLVADRDGM